AEYREDVVHTLLECGQLGAHPVGQAGAAAVNQDETAKRSDPPEHVGENPLLPVMLNVGMPGAKQHHVRPTVPDRLVSDRQAVHGVRVMSLGDLHRHNRLKLDAARQQRAGPSGMAPARARQDTSPSSGAARGTGTGPRSQSWNWPGNAQATLNMSTIQR